MSFLFPDVKDRTDFVKDLANKLNANYCFGIEDIKNNFNIVCNQNDNSKKNKILGKLEEWATEETKESNVIVGTIEDYDYCFIEYLHHGTSKYDSTKWISIFRLRLNEEFPDFQLKSKGKLFSTLGCGFFASSFLFLGVPLSIIQKEGLNNIGLNFVICLMLLMWVFLSILMIFGIIKMTYGQNKYKILNRRFKEKYAILGNPDIDKIAYIFSKKVCSKILKYPSEFNFTIKDNILINDNIGLSGKLSYETCEKLLKESLFLAKVLEGEKQN